MDTGSPPRDDAQPSIDTDDARALVARIKAAADAYLAAIEHDLAGDLAVRLALTEGPLPSASPEALIALRTLGTTLPGTHATTRTPPPGASAGSAGPTGGPEVIVIERRTGATRTFEVAMSPPATERALQTLWSDFQQVDFQAPSNEMFRLLAEEYACRGRELQERGTSDPSDIVGRVIRKLTALATMRSLRDVFGLRRAHQGDWQARVRRAREEQQRLADVEAGRRSP